MTLAVTPSPDTLRALARRQYGAALSVLNLGGSALAFARDSAAADELIIEAARVERATQPQEV